MPTTVGEAFVSIRPDVTGFEGEARAGIQNPMGKMAVAIGALFAANKVKDWIGGAVDAARESIAVSKQTEAVIKSTGKAAGVSAKQVGNLATSLSKMAGVDDEVIQKGENLLLTFTRVRNEAGKGNDVFNQTIKAALDMSVALGTDLQGSVMQVGKALQNPVEGMAALQRVGVRLSDTQKQQVTDFMAVGDIASAQKVILGELTKEFGGSADAQSTASGRMQVAYGNLKESVGKMLIPIFAKLSEALQPVVEWMTKHKDITLILAGVIGGALTTAVLAYTIQMGQAAIATIAATWPFLAIAAAIGILVGIFIFFYTKWDEIWKWISENPYIAIIIGLVLLITSPITLVVIALAALAANWDAVWAWISQATSDAWDWIKQAFSDAVTFISEIPGKILDYFLTLPKKMIEVGGNIAEGLWNGILDAKDWLLDKVGSFVEDIVGAVTDPLGIFSPSRVMRKIGGHIVEGLDLGIADKVPGLMGTASSMTIAASGGLAAAGIQRPTENTTGASAVTSGAHAGGLAIHGDVHVHVDELAKREQVVDIFTELERLRP